MQPKLALARFEIIPVVAHLVYVEDGVAVQLESVFFCSARSEFECIFHQSDEGRGDGATAAERDWVWEPDIKAPGSEEGHNVLVLFPLIRYCVCMVQVGTVTHFQDMDLDPGFQVIQV